MTLNLPQQCALAIIRSQPDLQYPIDQIQRLDHKERMEFLELLRRHSLTGWAHSVLQSYAHVLPDDLVVPLAAEHRTQTANSILLLAAYENLSSTLSHHGIDHVPLKGIYFLRTLYARDPGSRSLGDIDILIRRENLPDADRALLKLGAIPSDDHTRDRQYRFHHHFHYKIETPIATTLELHWRLSSAFGVHQSPNRLWWRVHPSTLSDATQTERQLDLSSQLHWLLVHMASHGLASSLKWVLDIRLFLDQHPQAIRAAMTQTSSTLGACAFALSMVSSLGGSVPAKAGLEDVQKRLSFPRIFVIQKLTTPQFIFNHQSTARKNLTSYGLKILLVDGLKERFSLIKRRTLFKAHTRGFPK